MFSVSIANQDTVNLSADTFCWSFSRVDAGFDQVYSTGSMYLLPIP